MLLRDLTLQRTALPFRQPFVTAQARLTVRESWLVIVRTRDGRLGVGEAAPLPGFTPETMEQAGAALTQAAAHLPGLDLPDATPAAADPLAALHLTTWAKDCPTARHALECALLDLQAQAAAQPLAQWLATGAAASSPPAAVPAAVSVNATLGDAPPEETLAQARDALAQGYGTLKLKVGSNLPRDTQRLHLLRRTLGTPQQGGPCLRVDANGALTRTEARTALRDWAALHLEYVEQPLPAEDLEGMAALVRDSTVPIAADDALISMGDAERVLAAQAAQVLVLKPMALGGLLPTLRVAAQAARHGVPVVVTTLLEGAFGRMAALHCAAAIQGAAAIHSAAAINSAAAIHGAVERAPLACGLATGALLARDHPLEHPAPALQHGALPLPLGGGLGLRPHGAMLGAD